MSIAPIPFFPVPPQQYNQQYMAEIVRAFSVFATQITNPAIAKPVLIEIPTSSQSGDEVGTVYETNTLLRIKSATAASNTAGIPLPTYTVASLPAVETGTLIYVSNGAAGSPVVAFGDGSNWLRCDTRAAVST
mgnify:FL=1|tara:strand:- start:220 stop:618 length:399 start_codon:yes stop_codon:yes gene_type:complete